MSFCIDDIASMNSVDIKIPNGSRAPSKRESTRYGADPPRESERGIGNGVSNYHYTDEPIQLIDFSKGFKINPKAMELLNSIKEDIIVVSVVGKARTGKSYLMNLLLDLIGRDDSGFKVASTLSSCTKGIWLWNNVKTSINSNAKILFLDSEGTSSTDKSTKTYDSRIFALVVLISSLFLYNTYSNIDEHGISELSLAAHLSNAITTSSDINKDELLTELSPKFIWIIRDFTLEKIHPETGQEITSKEYLELCLKNKRCGKNSNDNNLIRQNIIKFFPDRDCVTLVRPVDNESDLKRLNSIPFNNLKSDFKIEFKKLKDKIYKEALPKKYNGRRLNGPGLACLIEQFVKTINSGKIPNISNSWDNIIEKDINDSFSRALSAFKSKVSKLKVSSSNVYPQSDLIKKLYQYQYESFNIFNEIQITNADTLNYKNYNAMYEKAKSELKSQMNQIHSKIVDQNISQSSGFCKNILIDEFHQIEDKIYNNHYTVKNKDDISEDFKTLLTNYNAKGKGKSKMNELAKFLVSGEKGIIDYLTQMMAKENEKNFKKIDNSLKLAKAEIDDVANKRRVADTKDKYNSNKIESLEKEDKDLEEEINDLKDTLNMKKLQLSKIKDFNDSKKRNKVNLEETMNSNSGLPDKKDKSQRKKEACGCQCNVY